MIDRSVSMDETQRHNVLRHEKCRNEKWKNGKMNKWAPNLGPTENVECKINHMLFLIRFSARAFLFNKLCQCLATSELGYITGELIRDFIRDAETVSLFPCHLISRSERCCIALLTFDSRDFCHLTMMRSLGHLSTERDYRCDCFCWHCRCHTRTWMACRCPRSESQKIHFIGFAMT